MSASNSATTSFIIEANPGTDIWRKPGTNAWNAHTSSGPLKKFLSARVTFWAEWGHLYDQAGLLLVPRRTSSTASPPERWVKTGIELFEGAPHLSTVTCDRFADWGLYPLESVEWVTVEVTRDGGGQGKNVWVHRLVLDEAGNVVRKVPLRKICWMFADEDDADDWVLDVSPLVARPDKKAQSALKAEFIEFNVEWSG